MIILGGDGGRLISVMGDRRLNVRGQMVRSFIRLILVLQHQLILSCADTIVSSIGASPMISAECTTGAAHASIRRLLSLCLHLFQLRFWRNVHSHAVVLRNRRFHMGRHEVEDRVNLILKDGNVLRLWNMTRDGALGAKRVSTEVMRLKRRTEWHRCE